MLTACSKQPYTKIHINTTMVSCQGNLKITVHSNNEGFQTASFNCTQIHRKKKITWKTLA